MFVPFGIEVPGFFILPGRAVIRLLAQEISHFTIGVSWIMLLSQTVLCALNRISYFERSMPCARLCVHGKT